MALRKKLLLIDDNPAFCDLAQAWLAPHYDLVVANDAPAALQVLAAKAGVPDLVLLDVMMPAMSGIEFFMKIREDPRLKMVPVLFLTAYHQVLAGKDEALFRRCRVLLKPFRIEELKEQIEQMLAESPQAPS
ncbi:MAG: response regulator [Acidobacteriota bacterium]